MCVYIYTHIYVYIYIYIYIYLYIITTHWKVCFWFCSMFLFSCLLFWSLVIVSVCVMLPLPSCRLCYWFPCSMCSLVVLFTFFVSHWFVLVMWPSLLVISSHSLAFVSGRVLMLKHTVDESSLFMPCQVCLWSSLFEVKSVDVWISRL